MIQRVQSVLLILAISCAVLLLVIPSFYMMPAGGLPGEIFKTTFLKTVVLNGNTEKELLMNWPLLMLNCLIIFLYIVALFGYRNRIQQVKICNLLLFFQAGLLLLLFYYWNQSTDIVGQHHVFMPGWGIGFILFAIVLLIAARHYILKDEALVRSSERLR